MKTPSYTPITALQTILRWCDRGGEEPEGQCLHEIEQVARRVLSGCILNPPTYEVDRKGAQDLAAIEAGMRNEFDATGGRRG